MIVLKKKIAKKKKMKMKNLIADAKKIANIQIFTRISQINLMIIINIVYVYTKNKMK